MEMAKGACGDYGVSNPIAHLNGLTAILLEREEAARCCPRSRSATGPNHLKHCRETGTERLHAQHGRSDPVPRKISYESGAAILTRN